MTVFLVESGRTTTLFSSREIAEESVRQTRDRLVGNGLIGNLEYEISEIVVHTRVRDVWGGQ